MLEAVSADDPPEIVNWPIERLGNFRADVKKQNEYIIATARVFRRKKPEQQWNKEDGKKLDERVGAQIALPALLGKIPIQHAEQTREQQRREKFHGRADADSFRDQRRDQTHEANRHRQAIPDEAMIVRREMISAGAEADQSRAQEKRDEEPVFPFIAGARCSHPKEFVGRRSDGSLGLAECAGEKR